jgi:4-amino-4-deoxy-L-arabinose transferase-like glycosyltransferase
MTGSPQTEKLDDDPPLPNSENDDRFRRSKNCNQRRLSPIAQVLVFCAILICIFGLHLPLLRLPYIWDEAGYYIPAARDLFHSGSLIPYSTVSNAHPPLVMAWLALNWKVVGFRPISTRLAMLVVAAFTLLGVFRLAARVANREVAVASTVCTAVYSVFFAQSSLAHLDMAAAGFTLWALHGYLQGQRWPTIACFSLAALSKETAIIAPLALTAWALVSRHLNSRHGSASRDRGPATHVFVLLAPIIPLGLWFAYHHARTGHVFGNPEFFRYNVTATLHPLRIVLATGLRVWQLTGYMSLWLLTGAGLGALFLPPITDGQGRRPRIPIPVQGIFLALIVSYVLAMAAVGGAVLARYLLPVLPLVIILWVSTLWRRVPLWQFVIAIICLGFIAAWFVNPPYSFPFEDNLAYRDYILLHENAEHFLLQHHPGARVLTAWPASDELTRNYLGYVDAPCRVVRIDDFSLEQILSAAEVRSSFDLALLFSTKYEPPRQLLRGWRPWNRIKAEFFGFHRDLPPVAAAQVLGGDVIYQAMRNNQWIAIIEIRRVVDASTYNPGFRSPGPKVARVSFHDQPHITP